MKQHCGFAAIIGPPNVGKSTLVNALTGQKVAIVTHKAQTTRMQVRGIMMHKVDDIDAQIILVDTPGIFVPQRRLDRAMVRTAWSATADADLLALVLDASRVCLADIDLILDGMPRDKMPLFLILNQIDRMEKSKLLVLAQELQRRITFDNIFMISALHGDGLDALESALACAMPAQAWAYPRSQAADIPLQLLAAEITREKLFLRLHQELPYALTCETETWTRRKDGSIYIRQVIYVRRASQRAIILGEGGRMIKAIGRAAREEISDALSARVHLFLFVKIRADWQEDPARYRAMGLDYHKS